jgi:hypothetical protein
MEVEIKRLDVGSVVKVTFILYAVLGLVIGIIYMLATVIFSGLFGARYGMHDPLGSRALAMGLGVLMVPLMALLYGLLGALGGLIVALLYNVISKAIGGVKIRLKGEITGAGSAGDV